MNVDSPAQTTWNPWPIGLVAFLCLFASGVIGFGFFAARRPHDLVRPDYYEHEIHYQEQIDRAARTERILHEIRVELSADRRALELQLPPGAGGTLELYRPSDARLDRAAPIQLDPEGRQRIDLADIAPGLWQARVEWRVGAEEFYHHARVIVPTR